MKLRTSYSACCSGLFAAVAALATSTHASAQQPAQALQAPPAAEPYPAQPPVIQPLPPPAPPPPPPLDAYPPPPPGDPTVAVVAAAPAEAPAPATHPLHLSAFVDAYYAFQTAKLGTPVPPHRAYAFSAPGPNNDSPRTNENGFSLSFAGVDATYNGGQLGATISLRAGPSVPEFYGGDKGFLGIDNITQAYATWTPIPQLTLDIGQFATIFGAEVAESWQNLNYTRGALYYLMQPFWHTGLRATVSPSEQVSITGMVVNGVNSITEDNDTPSLALQLSLTPNEMFSLAGGWYTVLRPSTDSGGFDNFFDLVAALTVQRFSLVFNADLVILNDIDRAGTGYTQHVAEPRYWGLSLAAGYQATDQFGIALRGEVLSDDDNVLYQVQSTQFGVTFPTTTKTNLGTITGTLDFKPVPGSSNLIIRWDNRIEFSNKDIFFNRKPDPAAPTTPNTDVWFGSVVGVVVTTDG